MSREGGVGDYPLSAQVDQAASHLSINVLRAVRLLSDESRNMNHICLD